MLSLTTNSYRLVASLVQNREVMFTLPPPSLAGNGGVVLCHSTQAACAALKRRKYWNHRMPCNILCRTVTSPRGDR
jgi:hypothetical protein